MRKFLVSNIVHEGDLNVGIAPGKFDTKQLILSAIVVLSGIASKRIVRFVRTMKREELAKCKLFINDDFVTLFPAIPSYHDIENTWVKNSQKILSEYAMCGEKEFEFVKNSVKEKVCNLEAIDCLMELYDGYNRTVDSFENALKVTLKLIEKSIKDSVNEILYYNTIVSYIERATANYITPPVYVQGWRNIVASTANGNKIEYAIMPDEDGTLVIEAFNRKQIVMKEHVRNMNGLTYSGRFFVKVGDMDTAEKVIERLPSSYSKVAKFA